MRFLCKKQKSFLAFFLILEFFVVSALPASAGLFGGGGMSIPSASSILSDMEQRYHLDVGAIQNQGEALNVAGGKTLVPEVSLFFNPSDPKPGEKLSAKALPIYFSNTEQSLYYTWYLKRKDCNSDNCDYDDNGNYDEADWKIAAARILAQNGYDNTGVNYSSDSDSDGYRARFGGDNKANTPDYCYVHDNASGVNYELAENIDEPSFDCAGGYSPVCMIGQGQVSPTSLDYTTPGNAFSVTDNGVCSVSGYPTCSIDPDTNLPVVACNVGTAYCVADTATTTSCPSGSAISSCAIGTDSRDANPVCGHLFPKSGADVTGNGSFGKDEEKFWGTDPNDPDTADNGNKDEANVVGLGQSTFTWNYVSGDEVGVAVEGTSMIPTKHNDSSYMIMWAFPKKDCPVTNTGSYTEVIRDYTVTIPAVDGGKFNLNSCIEKNLVDPTKGGQATNLEISVTATPDNPINDETADKGGDIIIAQASVSNAEHNVTDMFFDWKVEISKDVQFGTFKDITQALRTAGLLGNTRGNALDSIRVKLDMLPNITAGYFNSAGVGYLRFKSAVTENFSGNAVRKGKSDVIIKFTSTGKKISAYKAGTILDSSSGEQVMKATITGAGATPICSGTTSSSSTYENVLDRVACRVIKNEIIGLKVDNPSGTGYLSSFYWTVNGAPLTCSKQVSNDCSDTEQGNENFFPVIGNPGDTYTVAVTANDVSTGNVLTLSRTFSVVTPEVSIKSLDKNIVWPRLLGQYKDITKSATSSDCSNGLCNDYSTSMFEAFSGATLGFSAEFIPGFLKDTAMKEWSVDGVVTAESVSGEISFEATKPTGGIYNIGLIAQVKQSDEVRRALLDIWGISPFDSPEINFSVTSQVQLQEPGLVDGSLVGPRKYLAAIVSYVPAPVMFTFRIFLSAVLVLFSASFLYALLEDRRAKTRPNVPLY